MNKLNQQHRPLVMHVIYRLGVGGLENGLVNIINNMNSDKYRHMVVSLTETTDFADRISRDDIDIVALHKRPGHDLRMYWNLFLLMKKFHPEIVHTRNIGAMDAQLLAFLAGVRNRVHGEHGWEVGDIAGGNKKHQLIKRILRRFISTFIVLSREQEEYLKRDIKVSRKKIRRIINGVDISKFRPGMASRNRKHLPSGFYSEGDMVFGYVGRLEPVKGVLQLMESFNLLVNKDPGYRKSARLVYIGDGSLRTGIFEKIDEYGLQDNVWLAGSRNDVPDVMRDFDILVLPSLAEGISNTIMEGMASGLPVVATDVGGNRELVIDDETGYLVPSMNAALFSDALEKYFKSPRLIDQHGNAARMRVVSEFSLETMVGKYQRTYDELLDK